MGFTESLRQLILADRRQGGWNSLGASPKPVPGGFLVVTNWHTTTSEGNKILEIWHCKPRATDAVAKTCTSSRQATRTAVQSRLHFSPLRRWLNGVDGFPKELVVTCHPYDLAVKSLPEFSDHLSLHEFPSFKDEQGCPQILMCYRLEQCSELEARLRTQHLVQELKPATTSTSHPSSQHLSSATLARGSFSPASTSSSPATSASTSIPIGSPDPRRRGLPVLQRAHSLSSRRSKLGCFGPSRRNADNNSHRGLFADADIALDDSEFSAELALPSPPPVPLSLQSLISPPLRAARSQLSASPRPWIRSPTSFRVNLEESLLGNAIPSSVPCAIAGFTVKITTSSTVLNPEPVKLPVVAKYYHLHQERFNPYVASLNLSRELKEADLGKKGKLRVPKRGQLQLVVFNPEQTGVKVFVVPYNLSTMPANHRTRLRQRTHVLANLHQSATTLLYALHVQLQTDRKGRLFLVDEIKMVLASRPPHDQDSIKTETTVLDPVATPPKLARKPKPTAALDGSPILAVRRVKPTSLPTSKSLAPGPMPDILLEQLNDNADAIRLASSGRTPPR
eukprot:TRINITY_DN10020_c0_g2_i2.p1 TRINITY_DN10020_c0_g2~~TRINITY_DN10020_c0_g2_i2.p1  ORF type:complete len:565 (+),score=74.24 TRINITY_DN10020_c0_g2_i2:134-1828(+)